MEHNHPNTVVTDVDSAMLEGMGAKKETSGWPDVVRLASNEQKQRLARLEEAMSAKLGASVPRTTVLEAVITRGLEGLEPEYGVAKGKR
jgi:hypothetical protein